MEFTHNQKTDVWEGEGSFHDRVISIQIASSHPAEQRAAVVTAALRKTRESWAEIQDNLAASLLETFNDGWSDPDEGLPELSRAEFLEKVKLTTLYVMEEGAISLYFDDADLFAGHIIEIYWRPDKMYEASIAG